MSTTTKHKTATREEWLTVRLELLGAEKAPTRQSDDLARRRRELPWVRIDKAYRFDTDAGGASLADLFRGRSQLLVYHFMFGPEYSAGCPSCAAIADGFNGFASHLAQRDVTLCAVSLAPLAKLLAFKQRMGWSFPWASSRPSDFNFDFAVSFTEEQERLGDVEYNFHRDGDATEAPVAPEKEELSPWLALMTSSTGTDQATYRRQMPGVSAFVRDDGVVYHTYSSYARGLDGLWGMYQWLDRTPFGRGDETLPWFRHHTDYDNGA